MTQPSFVPVVEADQVRRAYQLHVPEIWTTSRPSELRGTRAPSGAFLGTPGPDQGFALKLARRFEDRLVLGAGEQAEDAIVGCTAVAMRRAASFGRAPVIHDLTLAFTLWGFLAGAPADLVATREPLFRRPRTTTRRSASSPTAFTNRPCGSRPTGRRAHRRAGARCSSCPKVTEQPLVRFPVHPGDPD